MQPEVHSDRFARLSEEADVPQIRLHDTCPPTHSSAAVGSSASPRGAGTAVPVGEV